MAAITGGFSSLLAPGLRKVILNKYDEASLIMPKIFNVLSSSKNYEDDRQIAGFGTVPSKNEGSEITFEDPLESYTKRYTHTTYGLGFKVSMEMWQDDLYGVMRKLAAALGRSARATVETQGANIFVNGFGDTGPDASALFATGHALKGGGTSTNMPSAHADLTVASLEAAIVNFKGQLDDKSLKLEHTPKILLVSTSDELTAEKLVGSAQQPFTADNQINVIRSRGLQVIAWPYLTDTDAWFLLSAPDDREMNFFWRMRPAVSNDDDFKTGDALYKIVFRCSVGYSDWRGAYGTSGA